MATGDGPGQGAEVPGSGGHPEVTGDAAALAQARDALGALSGDKKESHRVILSKTGIKDDPTKNETTEQTDKQKEDAERAWAERIGGSRLDYDPKKIYETASDDPRLQQLIQANSLRYLEDQDGDLFHGHFSGEVSDTGYLIDNSGNETVFLPSQNIGAQYEKVVEQAKADFQKLYPDAAEGYMQYQKHKDGLKTNPDPNFDIFRDANLNPEAFTPEALQASAEKVARYLGDKLKGLDEKPLPDDVAESILKSLGAERDARVQAILLQLAADKPVEQVAVASREDALDTMLLGMVVDYDAAYRESQAKYADRYKLGPILEEIHGKNDLGREEYFKNLFKAKFEESFDTTYRSQQAPEIKSNLENPEPKPPALPQVPTQS